MAQAMDLNSNVESAERQAPRDSRNAPSAIQVRNLCAANGNNINNITPFAWVSNIFFQLTNEFRANVESDLALVNSQSEGFVKSRDKLTVENNEKTHGAH